MKKLKVGVFGCGRGMHIARNFMLNGCEIVAICDFHKERREAAAKQVDASVAVYDNFDEFINHDMDAMILANFFHEHAPYAARCLEKGIHVFSECISNGTMAEGVELIKAFEKSSGAVYFMAENYPQMICNREIQRVCKTGTLGKILYAEGEYNHPVAPDDVKFRKEFEYFQGHWRNFIPRAYYITHSLGPVMAATGATAKRVTSFSAFAPVEGAYPVASYGGDRASIVTTQNDDGSVFRVTGWGGFGAHHNSYRICGTEGQIENLRGTEKIMLRYNDWSIPEGKEEINCYVPSWEDKDEELIKQSGHGGADFITARMFIECVIEGKQPPMPFDVYSAVNMSSVAILAHRSMLGGGKPYDIPDFTKEEDCKQYENDRLSPFTTDPANKIPACSHPDFAPSAEQIALYEEALKNG